MFLAEPQRSRVSRIRIDEEFRADGDNSCGRRSELMLGNERGGCFAVKQF